MQIVLKNISYNKFNDLNLNINTNSIIGIVGPFGCGKTDLSLLISKKISPDNGEVILDIDNNKIGIITSFSFNEMLYGSVLDFIKKYSIKYSYKIKDIDERVLEIIKMVGLKEEILSKSVFNISKSEKIKVLLSQTLLFNPELIILDNVIEELDNRSKTKLFKLIIKLKKFYNKTIIITSSNINLIYEYIDDLVILDNGNIISYGNKYDVYNSLFKENIYLDYPMIVKFSNLLENKRDISLGNNDCINELIKAIYREFR